MEEDCNWKPCEIKIKSEFIPDDDDDVDDNYSKGPCQVASSEVRGVDPSESVNVASSVINPSCESGGVPGSTVEIKVEITEDEDPLAGAVPSEKWPIPPKTSTSFYFKEETSVFLQDFTIKSENASSEENSCSQEIPIDVSSKLGDKKGTMSTLLGNCDTRNTCSIGIKTGEMRDFPPDINRGSLNQTLPKDSDVRCYLDKQPPPNSRNRPIRKNPCPARFINKNNPTAKVHSGEEYFSCKYCPARFDEIDIFLAHVRTHNSEKPFSCRQCSARYALEHDLFAHVQTHSDGKPFPCAFCPLRFTQQESLQVHLRVHSGEKSFLCKHCPARFGRRSNLSAHLRIHSGDKPYSCTLCSARFTHRGSLSTHLRFHSGEKPFSCTHCSARFNSKGNLTAHLRVHSGEKPYSCEQCSAQFNQKSNLMTHLRSTAHEKQFICQKCSATFRWKYNLKAHLRIHNDE